MSEEKKEVVVQEQEQGVESAGYRPTPTEERIIEALLNPENRMLNTTKLCEKMGFSQRSYYRAFANQGFVAYYNELAQEVVRSSVLPVIQAFEREARRGSYPHGKVLLEMGGIYRETVRKEVTGKDGQPVESNVTLTSRLDGLPEDQKEALRQELIKAVKDEFELDDTEISGGEVTD